jgi:hypothetical protein
VGAVADEQSSQNTFCLAPPGASRASTATFTCQPFAAVGVPTSPRSAAVKVRLCPSSSAPSAGVVLIVWPVRLSSGPAERVGAWPVKVMSAV